MTDSANTDTTLTNTAADDAAGTGDTSAGKPAPTDSAAGGAGGQPAEGSTTTTLANSASEPADEPGDEPGDKPGDKSDEPAGAPETYEPFKSVPGVELDQQRVTEFTEVAKELNLSQEAAQRMVTMGAQMMAQAQDAMVQAHAERVANWREAAVADKEIGGDKMKAQVLPAVATAIAQFGSKELQTMLDETGVGNHPELVRLLYRVGSQLVEGSFVSGQPGSQQKRPADILYGGSTPS